MLSLKVILSHDDYVKAFRGFYINRWRIWVITSGVLLTIVAGASLYLYLRGQLVHLINRGVLVFAASLSLSNIPMFTLWIPYQLAKKYLKKGQISTPIKIQISNRDLYSKDGLSETRLEWGKFQGVIETCDYFLLVRAENKNIFHIIPKRAFETTSDERAFRDLITIKILNCELESYHDRNRRHLNKKNWWHTFNTSLKVAYIGGFFILVVATVGSLGGIGSVILSYWLTPNSIDIPFTSRGCSPVLKENEQLIFDDVKSIGFVIPSNWIIIYSRPGALWVTQSFYSDAEARVNGTKCDLYLETRSTFDDTFENLDIIDVGLSTILIQKEVGMCGMNRAVFNVSTTNGSDRSMSIWAETKRNEFVTLDCFGVNTAPMVPILESLYSDLSRP